MGSLRWIGAALPGFRLRKVGLFCFPEIVMTEVALNSRGIALTPPGDPLTMLVEHSMRGS
jgi:hypothetical protein